MTWHGPITRLLILEPTPTIPQPANKILFILLLLSSLSGRRKKGCVGGWRERPKKAWKGKGPLPSLPKPPPFFPFFPVPYPFLPLLLLGTDIIQDPQFDSSVGNKLCLYSELRNEVRFESYLDLIKNVETRVAYLLNLGATRRYPELRGFAPFVIDPKLVMNSTICWSVLTHHFLI